MNILDDILKQQHYIEARANYLSESMVQALLVSLDEITGKLVELRVKLLRAETWQEESLARKQAYLLAQAEEIQKILSQIYLVEITPLLESATLDTSLYIEANTIKMLGAFYAVQPVSKMSLEVVKLWEQSHIIDGLLMAEWLKRMENTSAERIIQASRQALIQGMSVQQTASYLRKNGIEGTRPQIEALSRTFLLSASNYAREETMSDIGADLDHKWQYVATLDSRTCLICGADDEKIYTKDDSRPSLPRHINCRCVYVPIFEDSPQFARPTSKHSKKLVHHRDGSISTKFKIESAEITNENYSQWINRQLKEDPAFVRSILGKTRFELFERGELTLNKMVVDNRIKTLAEL